MTPPLSTRRTQSCPDCSRRCARCAQGGQQRSMHQEVTAASDNGCGICSSNSCQPARGWGWAWGLGVPARFSSVYWTGVGPTRKGIPRSRLIMRHDRQAGKRRPTREGQAGRPGRPADLENRPSRSTAVVPTTASMRSPITPAYRCRRRGRGGEAEGQHRGSGASWWR